VKEQAHERGSERMCEGESERVREGEMGGVWEEMGGIWEEMGGVWEEMRQREGQKSEKRKE